MENLEQEVPQENVQNPLFTEEVHSFINPEQELPKLEEDSLNKPILISNFDELEKAQDLEELLRNNNIQQNEFGYIVGNKYHLTENEYKYFTEVVYKIK